MPRKQGNNPNAGKAAVLSFLFNGLGQIYNGQIKKGLQIMSASTIGMIVLLVGAVIIGHSLLNPALVIKNLILGLTLFCIGIVFIAIIGTYNLFDAYNNAK